MAIILKPENAAQFVFFVRGEKVMLDVDLAKLYGVDSCQLNNCHEPPTTKKINVGAKRQPRYRCSLRKKLMEFAICRVSHSETNLEIHRFLLIRPSALSVFRFPSGRVRSFYVLTLLVSWLLARSLW
jgi:hypothetical protein